jgi:hypothetical protein
MISIIASLQALLRVAETGSLGWLSLRFRGRSADLSSNWASGWVHRSTQAVMLTAEGRERILLARRFLDATRDVRMRHKRADDAYE